MDGRTDRTSYRGASSHLKTRTFSNSCILCIFRCAVASHLYKRVCPSVHPSVGPSVHNASQMRARRILCRVFGLVYKISGHSISAWQIARENAKGFSSMGAGAGIDTSYNPSSNFQMRSRISIRGSVHPFVSPSVGPSITPFQKLRNLMKYRVFHIKCNILKRHISASSNARKFRKKVFER